MTKQKLLLVVGAGASVDFGMPSVAGVRAILNNVAQERYPLLYEPSTNLYECIEEMVRRYWDHSVPSHLRRTPHFEDLLYTIFALAAAYPAGVHTSALGALVTATTLPHISMFARRENKAVGPDILRDFGCALVDILIGTFRDRCIATEVDRTVEFRQLQALVAALQAEFEVAVVTLNYDNVVYRALPGIEIGFDPATGRFEERRILNRPGWPCMLHLHGSVHFDMVGSTDDMHEIFWQSDIRGIFHQNAGGRGTRSYTEGADFPTSVLVAGYGKTTQLLRRPFRTYYSELDRLVVNCDAALFVGYGFGDVHLNMAFEGFRDARRRPVVILGHAPDDAMTMGGVNLGDHNPMITALIHTFQTMFQSMRALGYSAPDTVKDLRAAQEFEVSIDPDTPLALWYNGLLAACANPGKIIARLR